MITFTHILSRQKTHTYTHHQKKKDRRYLASIGHFPVVLKKVLADSFFFFLIRNEEDYINIRTNTGEIKETREREKKPREG